jgi:hypothetical protein
MNIEHPTSNIQPRTLHPSDDTIPSEDTAERDRQQVYVHQYKVRIGHTEVTVGGNDASEAVRNARRRLAGELPRLWDVIYRMSEEEFRVEEIH